MFQVLSFTKSDCRDFIPNSTNLNPLEYQVWGECWSLITSCNQSWNSSQVYRCTLADLVCFSWESHCKCYIASDCRHVCQL